MINKSQSVLYIYDELINNKEIRLEDKDIYNTYKEFLNNPYGMQKILFNE